MNLEKKIRWTILLAAFRLAERKGNIKVMEALIKKMEKQVIVLG